MTDNFIMNNFETWEHYHKNYFSIHRRLFEKIDLKLKVEYHRPAVLPIYAGKKVMTVKKTNAYIKKKIISGEPIAIARFGWNELSVLVDYLDILINGQSDEINMKLNRDYENLKFQAGFFSDQSDESSIERFSEMMIHSISQVDLLAMWHMYMEDYIIKTYMPQTKLTYLLRLEPWLSRNPWSQALKGKKVLVIHPFADTIQEQYKKREVLFADPRVLPEFELKTFKSVQTIGGCIDERFRNWFEALEYMTDKILAIEFDVAIIGCGAYGMPLATNLKKAGKQAIHLGGATQLMFGIKGKRWEEGYYSKIASLMNEHWVYPSENEKPSNFKKIEKGCYW